ncbi:MAG: hypothetical protein IT373_34525 [Polyangiaceae bacterium]|nr:hypothetical protein [Polyangiaceae bacterium]
MPVAASCGDDDGRSGGSTPCNPAAHTGCDAGQVCEEVQGGQPGCFAPLLFRGRVFDLLDDQGIAGARVLARDESEAALSTVVVTDATGGYELAVPAMRSAAGVPIHANVTLRVDAFGYAPFPKAPRVALPIDLGTATSEPFIVENPTTDVGLAPLPSTTGLGSLSGHIEADFAAGALVDAGGVTGIADFAGDFAVYNVPAGSVEVTAYGAFLSVAPETVTVTAGAETADVLLAGSGLPTATISGNVQIVNAPGGSTTSVLLAVEDTFDEALRRGEAPIGLRAENVSGAFAIEGVPAGNYVVLASFDNDGLVQDPDTSIGGTEIVHIVVDGQDQALAESFKVTGALAVIAPAELEVVAGLPTLAWEDDSSEDEYLVRVYDALGTLVWETQGVFDPGGSSPATVAYAGPLLESGMIYQFRAVALKGGVAISATEDLKGLFVAQ